MRQRKRLTRETTYRKLRKALRAWAGGEMPKYKDFGICFNLDTLAAECGYLCLMCWRNCEDVVQWKYFSGSGVYPVRGGRYAYTRCQDKWKGKQGIMRRELCEIMLRRGNMRKIIKLLPLK